MGGLTLVFAALGAIGAVGLAFKGSFSWLTGGRLLLSVVIGLGAVPLSTLFWLRCLAPKTLQSQEVLAYLNLYLPLWVWIGGITGAWSMALGRSSCSYRVQAGWIQALALGGSCFLTGLISLGGLALLGRPMFGAVAITSGILGPGLVHGTLAWGFKENIS